MEAGRKKKAHYLQCNNNSMIVGFSSEIKWLGRMGRIKWNSLKCWKNRKQKQKPTLQPRVQNPGKILFINEVETNTLSGKEKKEFIATRPILKNC